MNRGLTNIQQIESQKVEEREVTGSEAEELLRKYGYGQNQRFSTHQETQPVQQPALTFEEMVKQEQEKRRVDEQRKLSKMKGPQPITFNGNGGYESEVKYGSDDEMGFGFRIEITTDMKLPK